MTKNEKSIIRAKIEKIKKSYSDIEKREKSVKIFSKLEKLQVFIDAKYIFIYWSKDDEVKTQDFINKWCKTKSILLPVVENNHLIIRKYTNSKNMTTGAFNIKEPLGNNFDKIDKIDLAIIPGIAFDKKNNRLGRGGGYYDKFLQNIETYKVGVCFDFQVLDNIPTESHDLLMNEIIFA
jgi:5-formyltetrahydrofolate cyclo-ligase